MDTSRERLPVELVPHRAEWAAMAQTEAARLREAIGGDIVMHIHHIGSTSIPGICAKPTIDLMAVVTSHRVLEMRKAALVASGYEWLGEFGIPGRRFISLTEGQPRKRLFNVHCFENAPAVVARHLAFRDYMRSHPDTAKAYEAEKLRARDLYPNDTLAYSQEKGAWIKQAERAAVEWYNARHSIASPGS